MQVSESSVLTPAIDDREYFADDRISNSDLGNLKVSPSFFRKVKDKQEKGKTSSGFRMGSLIDCKILTPHLFEERYRMAAPDVVFPSTNENSYQDAFCKGLIEGKDPVEAYVEAGYSASRGHEDRALKAAAEFESYVRLMKELEEKEQELYSFEDQEVVSGILNSIDKHRKAKELLYHQPEDGEAVAQFIIFFSWKGVECRCMIDRIWIDEKNGLIEVIDLKSTAFPLHSFWTKYRQYDYHRQQAFYLEAVRQWAETAGCGDYQRRALIVAVDKAIERGNPVKVFEPPRFPEQTKGLEGLSIEEGHLEADFLIDTYLWHQQNNLWDFSREYYENDGIEPLIPPSIQGRENGK